MEWHTGFVQLNSFSRTNPRVPPHIQSLNMEWHTVQRKVDLYRTNSTLRCTRVHNP